MRDWNVKSIIKIKIECWQSPTDSKYSAALSALLKLLWSACSTCCRENPNDINSVIDASKADPVSSWLFASSTGTVVVVVVVVVVVSEVAVVFEVALWKKITWDNETI